MTDRISVRVEGGEQFSRILKGLERKVSGKIMRTALREAARPILATAKQLVPVGQDYKRRGKMHKGGTLKRSLKIRSIRRSRTKMGVVVGTNANDNLFQGESFYGGFIEFGFFRGKRGKYLRKHGEQAAARRARDAGIDLAGGAGGNARQFVPATPFMRPAFDRNKDKARRIINDKIREGVNAVVAAKGGGSD